MMKKNFLIGIISVIFLGMIIFSFCLSFFNDKKYKEKIASVEKDVLGYLLDKYNEEFSIKEIFVEKVPYAIDVVSDEGLENSNFYKIKCSSNRLIEFDVVYVEYLDNDIYLENKEIDIIEPGIYDNYIYLYKVKDMSAEIKKNLTGIVENVRDVDVTLSDIGNYYMDNLLFRQTLDSDNEIEIYDKYLSYNKLVSNKEFYDTTMAITNGNITIDIDINNYIDTNNLNEFKKVVIELVDVIKKMGYDAYEINLKLNKYQSANVCKYLSDDKEQIYLMFEYESYSNEENKLTAYILDK